MRPRGGAEARRRSETDLRPASRGVPSGRADKTWDGGLARDRSALSRHRAGQQRLASSPRPPRLRVKSTQCPLTSPVTPEAYNSSRMSSTELVLLALLVVSVVAVFVYSRTQERRFGRVQAELDLARRTVDEQKAALAESKTQLREMFGSLSKDALKENRQDFLSNADALLKPVRDTLEKVQAQLAAVDKEREGTFRAVSSQISSLVLSQEQLRQTTEGLSKSLRSPERPRQMGRSPAQAHRRAGRHARAVRLHREGKRPHRGPAPARRRISSSSCPATRASSSTRRCRSTPISKR